MRIYSQRPVSKDSYIRQNWTVSFANLFSPIQASYLIAIITHIRSNCLFLLCIESVNYCPAKVLDINWDYTVVWFSASLFKTPKVFTTCGMTMRARFIYTRRRYATMVEIMHSLATLNANNFVVYGQKKSVGTRFLSYNERNILRPKLSRLGRIFCFAIKPHPLQLFHWRNAAKYVIKWLGNKTAISCLFVV